MARQRRFVCHRVGDWDWAVALLAEWSTVDMTDAYRIELTADQSHPRTQPEGWIRSAQIAAIEPLVIGLTDPQFEFRHRLMAVAWTALAAGRFGDTVAFGPGRVGDDAVLRSNGVAAGRPCVALGARRSGSPLTCLTSSTEFPARGAALTADIQTVRAGLAALEGRTAEATSLYRDALRAWQALGLQWDEALCSIDMATVLDPSDPEVRAAGESSTAIRTRLGATPYLAHLSKALSRSGPVAGDQPPTEASAASGAQVRSSASRPDAASYRRPRPAR